jgi:hypothetical protein
VVAGIELRANKLAAEDDLVFAMNPVHIVGNAIGVHVEMRQRAGAAVQAEFGTDAEPEKVRVDVVHVDADRIGTDSLRGRHTVVAAPVSKNVH